MVGIMSPGFAFPDAQTDFWIPLTSVPVPPPSEPRSDSPNSAYADGVFAKLRGGVSIEAASRETDAVLRTLGLQRAAETGRTPEQTGFPPSLERRAEVLSIKNELVAPVRPMLQMLSFAALVLLFIASANLITLFLERVDSTRLGVAVRTALGATRQRDIAAVPDRWRGAGGGRRSTGYCPRVWDGSIGSPGRAAGYSSRRRDRRPCARNDERDRRIDDLRSCPCPRLRLAVDAHRWVGREHRISFRKSTRSGFNRMSSRTMVVAAEVALAVVRCVGAGLLVRSFVGLVNVNPGYDAGDVMTFQIVWPSGHVTHPTRLYEDVLSRLDADPSIQAVAAPDVLPTGGASAFHMSLGGLPVAAGSEPMFMRLVTGQYFDAMGMRIVGGRSFLRARSRRLSGTCREPGVRPALFRRYEPAWPAGG